ncbi:MAG: DUF6491 family protein [Pseudomonadota bacterium]
MRIRTLSVFFVSAMVTACASKKYDDILASPANDPSIGAEVDRVCFRNGIDGFSNWEAGQGLILRRTTGEEFLVTFRDICFAASQTERIGFTSRFQSTGCIERSSPLFISDKPFPGASSIISQSCLIDRVYAYTSRHDTKP